MPMPSEEEMQNAPVALEVSLRVHGETVRCQGFIPPTEWGSLENPEIRFDQMKISLAKAMGAVLDQVERSKMLQDPQSCPDPVQSPE